MAENKQENINPNNKLESIQTDTKQLMAKVFIVIGLILFLFILVWFIKSNRSADDDAPKDDDTNNSLIDSVKHEKDFAFIAEPRNSDEIIEILPSRGGGNSSNGGFGGNGGSGGFGSGGSGVSGSGAGGANDSFGNSGASNFGGGNGSGSSSGGSGATPFQVQAFGQSAIKPRIIKGQSKAVIVANQIAQSGSGGVSSTPSSSASQIQDKRGRLEKLLEEEAKNGGGVPNLDEIIEKVTSNLPIDVDDFGNVVPKKKEDSNFTGEVFQPTSAYFSEFNQTLLLPKGSFIPCSLKTRIISELKGGIACIVANNVYSANGQTLLIEKGSTITGSYTNAEINDATTRLYVIWEEIKTPLNIVIPISSGGSDTLGGAGVEGRLDNHYVERFGAAIMLSVIDGGIKILGNYVKNLMSQNDNIQFNEASNMAATVMRKTMNIKPTLYRNHGDLVGVYVNKDVDFSKVYRLRRKK